MNENERDDLNLDIDFTEGAGEPQAGDEPQGAPQAAQQPAPQPAQPIQQPVGPNVARVQAEMEAVKQRYQEHLQRKKQLQEAGYPVPPEVEEALIRATARLETLQYAMQDAARRDAELRVPQVVQELLRRYPPQVAKVMEPHLREALTALAHNSPQLLSDPSVLNNVAYIALGRAQEELMRRRASGGAKPGVEGEPPPAPQSAKPEAIPERIASRVRISQEAWDKVAKADPSEYLDLDW